jgi:hypothetical protein
LRIRHYDNWSPFQSFIWIALGFQRHKHGIAVGTFKPPFVMGVIKPPPFATSILLGKPDYRSSTSITREIGNKGPSGHQNLYSLLTNLNGLHSAGSLSLRFATLRKKSFWSNFKRALSGGNNPFTAKAEHPNRKESSTREVRKTLFGYSKNDFLHRVFTPPQSN